MRATDAFLIAALALPVAAATFVRVRDHHASGSSTRPIPARHYVIGRLRSGREITMVFIGASFCQFSRNPDLPIGVARIRDSLAGVARAAGKNFATVGVALDEDLDQASAFIRKFGWFNEVVVGGGWLNTASLGYLVRGIPGRLIVPQIVVVERTVYVAGSRMDVGPDSLVAHILGHDILAAATSSRTTARPNSSTLPRRP